MAQINMETACRLAGLTDAYQNYYDWAEGNDSNPEQRMVDRDGMHVRVLVAEDNCIVDMDAYDAVQLGNAILKAAEDANKVFQLIREKSKAGKLSEITCSMFDPNKWNFWPETTPPVGTLMRCEIFQDGELGERSPGRWNGSEWRFEGQPRDMTGKEVRYRLWE